jgi:hypothetical protein
MPLPQTNLHVFLIQTQTVQDTGLGILFLQQGNNTQKWGIHATNGGKTQAGITIRMVLPCLQINRIYVSPAAGRPTLHGCVLQTVEGCCF